MRPVIGVTSSFRIEKGLPPRQRAYLNAAYTDAVLAAGGLPQMLPVPPEYDAALLDELLAIYDGLLFTGGLDLNPANYGQPPHPKTEVMPARRDRFELDLFRRADAARKPMLCVCLGHQVAHVARGGRLIQHIDDVPRTPPVVHACEATPEPLHEVRIEPGSRLAAIVGRERMEVNSRHHQTVDPQHPGRGLRIVARAPDGVIEASEDCDGRFLLTVQWHPEDVASLAEQRALFSALVAESSRPRRAG